ncbi:MAG TPA: peptide ABC transporter substrate-binding protein [Gemmatimonadaceae bacterium]|nr:peptide ABC transporter substrate-binding protein [Gemmatimonadaceae bacterium]
MMGLGRRASTPWLCSAALLLALSACAAAARSPGTVVIASGADLESANPLVTIHPLAQEVQRYVLFVTLARYDSALVPVPYFARAWRWSPDHQTLTLSLYRGLRWQDGAPTTARDVVFTLDAARDPATGYARYADLADIAHVAALNDTTVAIHYRDAQPRFPAILCELPIVPAHLLDSVPHAQMRRAAFNTAPVGNGPFRFVDRRAGQRWVFERNPQFPEALGGPPKLHRLVIAVIDEATTKFAGLVSGELDVAGISPTMASLASRDRIMRVINYPVLFSTCIIFNVHKPPFDDPRVRRALAYAINRKRIITAALAGYATPALGSIPPDHPDATPGGVGYDPARADSLLTTAGWTRGADGMRRRNGTTFTMTLLTVGSGDNAVEQLLQSDFAAVGVHMEIRQRELASFLAEARARPKRFDALLTGIPGDLSLAYLSSMYDSRLAGGALDYGGYHTPHLDSLLARAREAPSDSAARAAWGAVQQALLAQMPAAWIYHSRGVQGIARRLRGVRMDMRGELVSVARWYTDTAPQQMAGAR